MNKVTQRLAIALILVSLLASACSSFGAAQPTEQEIVINPAEVTPDQAEGQAATSTPRPTLPPTPTPEPVDPSISPTPTETLNPYDTLIVKGAELFSNEDPEGAMAAVNEAIKMDPNKATGY